MWPSGQELYFGCAVTALCQAAASAAFLLRRRREAPGAFAPPVTLFVPCAGRVGAGPAHLAAFLAQDYPGDWSVRFVVPSEADPAHGRIAGHLARAPDARARLVVTGLVPRTAAGKPLDLAEACSRADARAEVFAFADSDILPAPSWLRELVAPLADPAVGVTTAMTPFAAGAGLGGLVRRAWLSVGIPALELTRCPSGQSMALRRADFDALGLEGLWRRTLSEDMSLSRRLRSVPKAVRFVGRALPRSIDGMEEQGLFGVFGRWMALFRVYRPDVWALGAAATAWKLLAAGTALARGDLDLAAFYAAGESLNALVCWAAFRAGGPPGPEASWGRGLAVAAAAPFLPAVFAVNFAASAVVRTVVWGPYRYRVGGPEDVTAERLDGAP